MTLVEIFGFDNISCPFDGIENGKTNCQLRLYLLVLHFSIAFTFRSSFSKEYKHLALGENQNIRLFKLYRWNPFLGVRGTLGEFSLDCMPPYEAISYHWETVSTTRKIYMDGIPFAVSEATYDALDARGSPWRTRLVWIDYICIDQSNLTEKAEQIPLLRDIYSQASRVIV